MSINSFDSSMSSSKNTDKKSTLSSSSTNHAMCRRARGRGMSFGLLSITCLISIFGSFICNVSAKSVDYEYQLDVPANTAPQLNPEIDLDQLKEQSAESLLSENKEKLRNGKCKVECEEESATECLHCLRYIDARVLAPNKQEEKEKEEELSLELQSNMNQLVAPILWSSTLRNPIRMNPYTRQLLVQLKEAQQFQRLNPSSRAHKKDLRMALQRRLNEQDINSMLRNNWVG